MEARAAVRGARREEKTRQPVRTAGLGKSHVQGREDEWLGGTILGRLSASFRRPVSFIPMVLRVAVSAKDVALCNLSQQPRQRQFVRDGPLNSSLLRAGVAMMKLQTSDVPLAALLAPRRRFNAVYESPYAGARPLLRSPLLCATALDVSTCHRRTEMNAGLSPPVTEPARFARPKALCALAALGFLEAAAGLAPATFGL